MYFSDVVDGMLGANTVVITSNARNFKDVTAKQLGYNAVKGFLSYKK